MGNLHSTDQLERGHFFLSSFVGSERSRILPKAVDFMLVFTYNFHVRKGNHNALIYRRLVSSKVTY